MHLRQTIDKLILYKKDLYEGNIVIIPNSENISLQLQSNIFIQTDAIDYSKKISNITIDYGFYNYLLVRKFDGCNNIENELYYNFDDLKDNGLCLEEFFPFYPNSQILNYYLQHSNINKSSYQKYIKYASKLNENFYKNGI